MVDKISMLTKLLGEENEQRIRDSITDRLIDYISTDLDNFGEYLLNWDLLFDEIRNDLIKEVKNKVKEKYIKQFESKLNEVFGE